MHVRHFRYLGVLLLLVPTGFLAVFGLESLWGVSTAVWIGCTLLAGVGFVLAGSDRGPLDRRWQLAGSYLLVALATLANVADTLVSGGLTLPEPFALFSLLMAICFGYFAYAIGTDTGAFEFDFGG
ncbi:hypothetical protein [Haloarchaeobius sp. DT45]|uniref:hypothetical protein n=1 Tax=Haloarchaeobius sp. DT45 TaxID=3446116 RepID=UPI003F6A9C87